MPPSTEKEIFSIVIDGITVKVAKGTTVLQAARRIGGDVVPPAMCYYSSLKDSGGKCRTCLVEVTRTSKDNESAIPKLVASCKTEVMDGMEVKNITSDMVQSARKGVVEFLLVNHPLDCPVCDQAGECDLQDLSYKHGVSASRFDFERRTFEPENIGNKIQLHMNRCILCYRCVMVADQLTDKRLHGVLDRGEHAKISTHLSKAIDNDFSGNMIDVCPVGALTDKTFRFKNRVWFIQPMDAYRDCDKCSGKVALWCRGEDVYRVTARKDAWGEVEEFICNTCRYEKKKKKDWIIDGLRQINKKSVISQNHNTKQVVPNETLERVMKGVAPQKKLDIRKESGVNTTSLQDIEGPAQSDTFKVSYFGK